MEDNLEVKKMNLMIRAMSLDTKNAKQLNDFNSDWKKLQSDLSDTSETPDLKQQERLSNMFKSFKNDKGRPKTIKMKIGKPDRKAEFGSTPIHELVKGANA